MENSWEKLAGEVLPDQHHVAPPGLQTHESPDPYTDLFKTVVVISSYCENSGFAFMQLLFEDGAY